MDCTECPFLYERRAGFACGFLPLILEWERLNNSVITRHPNSKIIRGPALLVLKLARP